MPSRDSHTDRLQARPGLRCGANLRVQLLVADLEGMVGRDGDEGFVVLFQQQCDRIVVALWRGGDQRARAADAFPARQVVRDQTEQRSIGAAVRRLRRQRECVQKLLSMRPSCAIRGSHRSEHRADVA